MHIGVKSQDSINSDKLSWLNCRSDNRRMKFSHYVIAVTRKQETNRKCAIESECRCAIETRRAIVFFMHSNDGIDIAIAQVNYASCKTALPLSGVFHESLDNLSIKSCVEYESPVPPGPSRIKARGAFVKLSLLIVKISRTILSRIEYFLEIVLFFIFGECCRKSTHSQKDSTSRYPMCHRKTIVAWYFFIKIRDRLNFTGKFMRRKNKNITNLKKITTSLCVKSWITMMTCRMKSRVESPRTLVAGHLECDDTKKRDAYESLTVCKFHLTFYSRQISLDAKASTNDCH